MIRIANSLAFLTVILMTSGCAFVHSLDKDLLKQVEMWQSQHEYTTALDTIELVRKSHPQYEQIQKKKVEIQNAMAHFENARIREISAHIDAKDWHAAETSLNYTLGKLPDSKAVMAKDKEFKNLRAQHLKSLYYQLYINKAEWLVKNKDVQHELYRTIPDDRQSKNALKKHQHETEKVYKQLIECGIEALNIDDLELAEQCYLLADELKPGNITQATILDIQKELAKREKRGALVLSAKSRARLEIARQHMQNGRLKVAQQNYLKISSAERSHALVKAFKQELDVRIKENVKSRIETGRKLYSQGEIEQALAVWNKVKQLDPHNEYLNNHIERAQRVLDKVNEIKQQDINSVNGKDK